MDERNRIKVLEDRFDSEFEQHAMSLKVVTHAHDLGNSVDSLKSTLNEVSGLADLPAGVPERLSAAADQAERIRELARMIADPARGENRTRRSECDADEVVRGISRYLENQVKVISEGRGRLSLEIEPRVKGYSYRCRIDPLKLERILDNLVGNAAYWSKYSTPRGDVTVSVAPAPELAASQGVLVRVRDNGRGVAEEFKPFIFDRFFTRRDSSSSSAGLGLGLYLVKKYIDEVGGSISLKSNPGLTEFSILLPLVGSPD